MHGATRLTLAMAVTAALAAAAGCGDDEPTDPAVTQGSTDIERYCELTAQLDAAGDRAFEDVPEGAPEREIRAAIRRLLDENREALAEIE
ncbi:MAG TPA: hypothetical protein VGR12_01705, partial [Solirubrobacteraceae bacterium]|nr:hypothetical protein [Solirubrobacteraceae bacterium]